MSRLFCSSQRSILAIFIFGTIYLLLIREAENDSTHAAKHQDKLGGTFVQEHCDLQGGDWYAPATDWRRRTPYFMLIGAKKAGTTSLAKDLFTYPDIIPPHRKESLAFLPDHCTKQYYSRSGKVLVQKARKELLFPSFPIQRLQQSDKITFDGTPGHLYHSAIATTSILCTAGWTKILILLRDPLARTWSNYNFQKMGATKHGIRFTKTFEQWIAEDIQKLEAQGIHRNWRSTQELADYVDSPQGHQAWKQYTASSGEAIVGRSLYGIQLRHWFQALRNIGRDPQTEVLIVRTEDLKDHRQAVHDRIQAFLGLSSFELAPTSEKMVTTYPDGVKPVMNEDTKAKMEAFFEPYNKLVYDLLGGDWDGIWDAHSTWNSSSILSWPQSSKRPASTAIPRNSDPTYTSSSTIEDRGANNEGLPESSIEPVEPPADTSLGKAFTDRWCELTGADWWPEGAMRWKRRAPYFVLPGVKKSGTTSLAKYIMRHPMVEPARAKELHFYLPNNFYPYVDRDNKTLVMAARKAMYETDYHTQVLKRDSSLISFDASPGYFLRSTTIPRQVLCVAPWIKLVVIMRNPVSRVYSNWKYVVSFRKEGQPIPPFDRFVNADFQAMKQAGLVVQDPMNWDEFAGSPEEDAAWARYSETKAERLIGRSLYEIQLRHWFQAFREIGRDPRTAIHLVRTEDMARKPQEVYSGVLKFLGLPDYQLDDFPVYVERQASEPMSNATREFLQDFFAPYNQRFYKFLKDEGFGDGDWDGYWEREL